MTREEILKYLEEAKRLVAEEVDTDELTDYAREKAYYCIDGAIDYIKENEE